MSRRNSASMLPESEGGWVGSNRDSPRLSTDSVALDPGARNGYSTEGLPRATRRTACPAAGVQFASRSTSGGDSTGPEISARTDNAPANSRCGIWSGTNPCGSRPGRRRASSRSVPSRSVSSATNRPSRTSPSAIRCQPGATSSPDTSRRPDSSGRIVASQCRRSNGPPSSVRAATTTSGSPSS